MNQFDRDVIELSWRVAMGLWLENRDHGKIIGWTDPMRSPSSSTEEQRLYTA